jgi:hypothetical protein
MAHQGKDRTVLIVAAVAALGAVCLAIVQLRTGIIPVLDTVSYWSGARAVSDGHPFTLTVSPSFSDFGPIDLLQRGGRLPFVDFPFGYPTLAGVLAVFTGARAAMVAVTVAAVSALAALVVVSAPDRRRVARWSTAAAVVGMIGMPATRLTIQGTMSEPLFIILAVGVVVAADRHRQGASWWPVVALTMAAGAVRFVGAPLALIVGVEHWRRHRRVGPALGWTAVAAGPAVINALWASAAGGGHASGWRGIERRDIEVFVRSIAGWFDADQGDVVRSIFGTGNPAWWAWPLALCWVAVVGWALAGLVGLVPRLPSRAELCLAAAGLITVALAGAMVWFDALVRPDNRVMLPAGILTLCSIVWSLPPRLSGRWAWAAGAALAAWLVAASAPTTWPDLADIGGDDLAPMIAAVRDLEPGVVITDVADRMHWETGIPSGYTPQPVKALSGEPVDVAAVYEQLPCELSLGDGIVALADQSLFGVGAREALDEQVAAGRLEVSTVPGGRLYVPTAAACD